RDEHLGVGPGDAKNLLPHGRHQGHRADKVQSAGLLLHGTSTLERRQRLHASTKNCKAPATPAMSGSTTSGGRLEKARRAVCFGTKTNVVTRQDKCRAIPRPARARRRVSPLGRRSRPACSSAAGPERGPGTFAGSFERR